MGSMGLIRVVVLRDDQRTELVRVRDSAAKAYLRERAAAILKVAAGTRGPRSRALACSVRANPTPSTPGSTASPKAGWPGASSGTDAGASPLFPPQFLDPEPAKQAILHVVRRDPRLVGIAGTRWTLAKIHEYCAWLRTATPGGLSRLLARLEISWKRGRPPIHSP